MSGDITIAELLRAADADLADEIASKRDGRFPVREIIKADRAADFYVGWSHEAEAPVWAGTHEQALADGCPRRGSAAQTRPGRR